MRRLLVTGGGGLLGSTLRRICPDAIFVSSREADLRDRCAVAALFERTRPSHVLHLAARVGGVRANAERNADLFADNVLINTHVLTAAHREGVARLMAVLSSCAFPPYQDRPATESDLHAGLPFEGNLGYGYAKRMLDLHVRLLAGQYGWRCSTLAPVTMYGPHDNCDLVAGHAVGALIHRCWLATKHGQPFTVWGSGDAVRQFVFVEDVARLLLQALDSDWGPETVIVAPDDGITVRTLAERIARALDYRGAIEFDRAGPEGVKIKRLASERFAARFPGFRFTSLEEGLAKTVAWFLEYGPPAGTRPAFAGAAARD